MSHYLITGGARSGKSRRGLALAESLAGSALTFIATAQAFDDEMQRRIDAHQLERDGDWHTEEIPCAIAAAIATYGEGDVVLIDCLTLWLSNLFMAEDGNDQKIDAEVATLLSAVKNSSANLIFISNEVGMGIVPETALGREFRDAQGRLNQRLAAVVETVEFVVAGIPLVIKQP